MTQPAAVRLVCRHFRQKAMFIQGRDPEAGLVDPHSKGHCWCQRTQLMFGPDDEPVAPDTCLPGRRCHETY